MGKKKPSPKKSSAPTPPSANALVPATPAAPALPVGYAETLAHLKSRIRSAQVKAAVAVNRELTTLYWEIGKVIVERQSRDGWGKSIVDRLATDLQNEFPGESGFSPSNVWRMRAFYLAWRQEVTNLVQAARDLTGTTLPEVCASLPWFHNVALIEKVKNPQQRLWYAAKAVEHGWSRAVLIHQIESGLFERQGAALTNFEKTLPAPQSDLAREVLKDPYCFGFLTLADDAKERDLELGLLARLRDFLLELGIGFALVGNQYPLVVGGQDYDLDLLFYHLRLRCFVVIDLKVEPFKPEFAGKMNFYLSAVDDQLRHPGDGPSIGLILC